jgi:LmbE family N-acetylglucosaminyl deacetylase
MARSRPKTATRKSSRKVAARTRGVRRAAGERRLACIFAHPDDETYAAGAMIAKYAATGVHIDLFCATDGDAGKSSDVPVSSREELGAIRRNELISAARFLGVRTLALPGHRDGALQDLDPDTLTGEIVLALRTWRPHVVITFGPEGAPTGHRDHRAISRAATAAFFLSGLSTAYPQQLGELRPHSPRRLYYAAWARARGSTVLESIPATARIDVRDHLREQMGAFLLHATQRVHLESFRTLAHKKTEYFAFAAGVPQPTAMVEDLFEGLP